jgi:hypothetical protein
MAGLDLQIALGEGHGLGRPAVVLAVGLAAVLWPVGRRPAWLTPQLRTAVPALLSLLYTVSAIVSRQDFPAAP